MQNQPAYFVKFELNSQNLAPFLLLKPVEPEVVFQAETQAKSFSIELPPPPEQVHHRDLH